MNFEDFKSEVFRVYPSRNWVFCNQKEEIFEASWKFGINIKMTIFATSGNPSSSNSWQITTERFFSESGSTLDEAANKIHEDFSEFARYSHVVRPRPALVAC